MGLVPTFNNTSCPDYQLSELVSMKTIRSNKYFDIKYEDKDVGYRISLDKHIRNLVVVEKFNGNFWIEYKSFRGKFNKGE